MKKEEAIEKIRQAKAEADKAGVKVEFIITSADYNRPLKTTKGAIKKLKDYARHGLWCQYEFAIHFIGNNGKCYKIASAAAKYGK